MTLSTLLYFLVALIYPMHAGVIQPYNQSDFENAIVASGQGVDLWWYTPVIHTQSIKGAPDGWKGGTSCGAITGGSVYINPSLSPNEIPQTVMHELVHLHNNCHGSEMDAELSALDALAYMERYADVIYWLIVKISVIEDNPNHLNDAILDEYYRRPLEAVLYGDLTEYPYLLDMLVDAGVRE